ncbi:histidine phosphatase family protein [Demequina sp. NBRC 110056]|uniref:SixA phosphatase family protein n=1 Tax=Demequina sp. NBRC 110056 TaxID=1570345 RepID=UPI0009FE4B34|nr:histidine phosphatase family protein [Demequina sp. NBRC 110056]
MATLVLVRHAKAEAPSGALSDHDRALTLEGRSSATELGKLLAGAGVSPDLVLVSSANRTQQTWKLMSPAWTGPTVRTEPDLYETHVGGLHSLLTRVPSGTETVVVIGHEPTISAAAAWLSGPDSDTKALQRVAHGLPTGTAAVLDVPVAWSELDQRSAVLTDVVRSDAHF